MHTTDHYSPMQPPAIERFAPLEDAEAATWPWVRRPSGLWQVVDLARDVPIRRGMAQGRALEHARFAHRYAPLILGHNVYGRPIGLSGGYVFEVWVWNQCPRWEDGASGSGWVLEALCDTADNAELVAGALLERTLRHSDGPTAAELWAPTGATGAWEVLERLELDQLGREVLALGVVANPATPGPVMPWHLVAPDGTVLGMPTAAPTDRRP